MIKSGNEMDISPKPKQRKVDRFWREKKFEKKKVLYYQVYKKATGSSLVNPSECVWIVEMVKLTISLTFKRSGVG